jgi:hypothetical protein
MLAEDTKKKAEKAEAKSHPNGHLVRRGKAHTNPHVECWDTKDTYLVDVDSVPWTPVGPKGGEWIKLLNFEPSSGKYTILYKLQAGGTVSVHKHLGATEFFVLKGSFGYEAGDVGPGGYGYEYAFAVHEPVASSGEDLVMLVINYGNTQSYNPDGTPGYVTGMEQVIKKCRANNATKHLEPFLPFPPED